MSNGKPQTCPKPGSMINFTVVESALLDSGKSRLKTASLSPGIRVKINVVF